jgi:iron complex outermembrane receptor protein
MTRSRKRKLARVRDRARTRAKWAGVPLASAVLVGSGMAATDADQSMLEEVTVTAQKRSEDLQKVPISLQVLSGETLQEHQVSSFDDYAKFLPSVTFQTLGPGQAQLYFRGIASGADGLHAGSLPATGVYLDEIPVTTIGNTLDVHTYDIARVEALAGPQGTLYGASSLSGTLRIITNKPDPTAFSASYDVKADKYGRGNGGGEVEGYVNMPINDKMAIRLVGFYDHQGGYINNVLSHDTILFGTAGDPTQTPPVPPIPDTPVTYNNGTAVKARFNPVDTYGGRAALKIDLNDNWTITPQLLAQGQQAQGDFAFDPKKGNLDIADYLIGNNQDRWYQSAMTIEGKVANFDIVYSGGWFERKVDNVVDYSGYTIGYDAAAHVPGATANYNNYFVTANGILNPFQYNANHDKYTKMSHELRVSSPQNLPFRATAGLFYQRQSDNIRAEYRAAQLPDGFSVDGSPNVLYLSQQIRVDRDYAAFTDMTYDLTSQLKISGGIRKFYVNNTLYGFFGFNAGNSGEGSCNPPPSAATIVPNYWPCINTNKKVVENGETHRINLTYQIDPDRMVYATYSTGFRPGGNNRRVEVASYGSDTLTNIEGGWKTSWLNSRLRFNGAFFYERWKGVQLSVTGQQGITSIVNVGDARVKGVESEVSWLALDSLTITASATYVDAKTLQNFCNVDQVTEAVTHDCADPNAPAGTTLPVTPKLKANATARYRFSVGDYESFVQGSVIHQSSSTSQLDQTENALMGDLPSFTTFDFSAGTGMHNWKLEAYIENAFDKRGELGRIAQCAADYCFSHYHSYPIKPMNFGVKFGQKF